MSLNIKMPACWISFLVFISFVCPIAVQAEEPGRNLLLTDPVSAHIVETDTEALLHWRQFSDQRPALILISSNPFLTPIPDAVIEKGKKLVEKGSPAEIRKQAVFPSSHPTLLPGMALTMALELNWFSEILWVVPVTTEDSFPTLEQFKQRIAGTSLERKLNLENLVVRDECLNSTIESKPFRVCSNRRPVRVDREAIVHFDLSYFRGVYVNPVKTPMYESFTSQLQLFHQQKWPALQTTISGSMLQGGIALGVRLLLNDLKTVSEHPAEPAPLFWQQVDKVMYLQSLFQNDQAHEILLQLVEKNPNNPHFLYALYKSYRDLKKGDLALKTLASIVKLDSIYALEYLDLHELALKKRQPAAALRMLQTAEQVFPDNPWILWGIADFLASSQHAELALPYIKKLQGLTWSETYYPGALADLEQFKRSILENNNKEKNSDK